MRLGEAVIERLTRGDSRRPAEARRRAAVGRRRSPPPSASASRSRARPSASSPPWAWSRSSRAKSARVRSLDAAPLGRFFRFAVRAQQGRPDRGRRAAPHARAADRAPCGAERRIADDVERLDAILRADGGRAARRAALDRGRSRFPRGHRRHVPATGCSTCRCRALRPILREVMELFNAAPHAHRGRLARDLRAARQGRGGDPRPATPRRRSGRWSSISKRRRTPSRSCFRCSRRAAASRNNQRKARRGRRTMTDSIDAASSVASVALRCARHAAAPRASPGPAGRCNVFAHRVMQTVSTGSQGGDITRAWAQKSGIARPVDHLRHRAAAGAPVPRGDRSARPRSMSASC